MFDPRHAEGGGAPPRLTHTGVGMLSDARCKALAARLGALLLSIGYRDVVDRLHYFERDTPPGAG